MLTSNFVVDGTGTIWIDDLKCSGRENSLLTCNNDLNTGDCSPSEDTGVICSSACPYAGKCVVNKFLKNMFKLLTVIILEFRKTHNDLWITCRHTRSLFAYTNENVQTKYD